MKKTISSKAPIKENVQRLEQKLVPLNGETENTLPCKDEGEDIVHTRLKSKEVFLERAYKKYGNKFTFDLSNYLGMTKKKIKIFCDIHGKFEQYPNVFLYSNCLTGCPQCGRNHAAATMTKSYQDFVKDANKLYNNKYAYPKTPVFVNRRSKIEILCKEHGSFIKSAQKHLAGQACWECKIEQLVRDNILVGGYSEELFKKKPILKNKAACLYYISINNGVYYKLGISTTLKTRMRGIKCKSKGFIKSMDLLWTIEDTLYNCFRKEQALIETHKADRVYFKWSTETFNKNILPLKISNL